MDHNDLASELDRPAACWQGKVSIGSQHYE